MEELSIIVAIGSDGAIGRNGDLIWMLPGDLKRFKQLTMGHPVIMGRKTWDSLPKRPLAGRRNIVVTRNKQFIAEGAETANSATEALELARGKEAFVIGGAQIYRELLPKATKLYLTEVDDNTPDADARLRLNLDDSWEETERSEDFTNKDGIHFRYLTLKKKSGN